jgi:hypothetical protein
VERNVKGTKMPFTKPPLNLIDVVIRAIFVEIKWRCRFLIDIFELAIKSSMTPGY